jgi:hypothetical protein
LALKGLLDAPSTHPEFEIGPGVPLPYVISQRQKEILQAGEEFSDEMSQWCATSKFQSITHHPGSCGYQDVYAMALRHLRGGTPRILEIGIGVNDPSAPSGMDLQHLPGASLMGWAGYFPGAEIHGADVDRRCLVDTAAYTTHYVDQRDPESLGQLARRLGPPLDLIVDDGLHTPEANGNTIRALLPFLSPMGVMVIEDIQPRFDRLWLRVPALLPRSYECVFYPSSVLRQNRPTSSAGGLAVIVHRTQ